MNLVRNERLKVTATLLNTLASGNLIVGIVTPTAAALYGITPIALSVTQAGIYGGMFLAIGGALHYFARHVLGGLRE